MIIPCKDAGQWLGAQLDALRAQDYPGPLEVIVADNGSTDDSRQVATNRPGVRVVDASERRGPNFARNLGVSHATGEIILTCDADDVVETRWVTAMVAALGDHDLVAGRLDYETLNPGQGAAVEDRLEKDSRLGFLPAAATSNFGIRAEVLRALGGWDETLDYGFEDAELSWRAQLAGYRFGRADDAVVRYRLRTTTSAVTKQAYRGAQNLPVMVRRFRSQGMSLRPIVVKGLRFGGYLILAAPLALFSRRIRTEWLRKAAVVAGVVRGMFRRRVG